MFPISTALAFLFVLPAQAGEYIYSDEAFELADLVVEGFVSNVRCTSYYENDDPDSDVVSETDYAAVFDVREVRKGDDFTDLQVVFRDVDVDSNGSMGCGYLPEATLPEGWAGVVYLEETEDGTYEQVAASWPDSSADSEPAQLPDCGSAEGWDFGMNEGQSAQQSGAVEGDLSAGCQVVGRSASGLWVFLGLFGLIGRRR